MKSFYDEIAREYDSEGLQLKAQGADDDGGSLQTLAREIRSTKNLVTSEYLTHERQLLDIKQGVDEALSHNPTQNQGHIRTEISAELASLLNQRNTIIRRFHNKMNAELLQDGNEEYSILSESARQKIERKAQRVQTNSTRSLHRLGIFDLAHDENASIVASAKDEYWTEMYNRAHGVGAFGNVDIAIKMESIGDYTVKGLNFDPGEIPNAIGRATVQAVNVLAASTGIPLAAGVNLGDSLSTDSSTYNTSVPTAIADAVSSALTNENTIKDYRNALISFSAVITSNAKSIGAKAETKDTKDIQDVVEKSKIDAENSEKEAIAAATRTAALTQINAAMSILESTVNNLFTKTVINMPAETGIKPNEGADTQTRVSPESAINTSANNTESNSACCSIL